jgi:hypothetical protein
MELPIKARTRQPKTLDTGSIIASGIVVSEHPSIRRFKLVVRVSNDPSIRTYPARKMFGIPNNLGRHRVRICTLPSEYPLIDNNRHATIVSKPLFYAYAYQYIGYPRFNRSRYRRIENKPIFCIRAYTGILPLWIYAGFCPARMSELCPAYAPLLPACIVLRMLGYWQAGRQANRHIGRHPSFQVSELPSFQVSKLGHGIPGYSLILDKQLNNRLLAGRQKCTYTQGQLVRTSDIWTSDIRISDIRMSDDKTSGCQTSRHQTFGHQTSRHQTNRKNENRKIENSSYTKQKNFSYACVRGRVRVRLGKLPRGGVGGRG